MAWLHHAPPVFNFSSIVVQRFHVICPATGALGLEWLVHANDPENSSEQPELPVGKVLPDFLGASYRERFFDCPSADGFTTLSVGI